MQLKDFVAQALTEISEGVRQAQSALEGTGAHVNPKISSIVPSSAKDSTVFGWTEQLKGRPVLLVSFDVAVTASEGTKTKGGIGVVTGIVSLGSTGATDRAQSAASRIAFQVPLVLPAS